MSGVAAALAFGYPVAEEMRAAISGRRMKSRKRWASGWLRDSARRQKQSMLKTEPSAGRVKVIWGLSFMTATKSPA